MKQATECRLNFLRDSPSPPSSTFAVQTDLAFCIIAPLECLTARCCWQTFPIVTTNKFMFSAMPEGCVDDLCRVPRVRTPFRGLELESRSGKTIGSASWEQVGIDRRGGSLEWYDGEMFSKECKNANPASCSALPSASPHANEPQTKT